MAKASETSNGGSLKACCLVSEMLEEMGLNSRKAREIRRQTLLGLVTFCQWQLARMEEQETPVAPDETRRTKGRRVKIV
ncbi:MAG: hypothetical protein K1Y01_07235 [Vicinamibacteria bacterium]|nr:hypothetical protein [Vicinamibacteria bacterium]